MEQMLGYSQINVSTTNSTPHLVSMESIYYRFLRNILKDKATRRIFWFFCLNFSFTIVEFVYGYITNSLGLTADAIHMLFDSTAIACSLIASVVASWPASDEWPFGFHRVETMAGFVNALALFFAAGHILMEAVERLWEPVELKTGMLMIVAILGLVVNLGILDLLKLVGIFAFDHGMLHSKHSHQAHDHHHHNHQHDHDNHECHGAHNHSHLMQGCFFLI